MKRSLASSVQRVATVAAALLCGVLGVAVGGALERRAHPEGATRATGATSATSATSHGAAVFHDVAAREGIHADLYVPRSGDKNALPAPWIVFVHERGWPAPDEKEREGPAIADAMGRRGIGVAVISFDVTEQRPLGKCAEDVADVVRELSLHAAERGLAAEPVLAGDELGASLVTMLALDPHFGLPPAKLQGVIAMNGEYELPPQVRPDAPPFLVLASHNESPRAAQSSRALTRALERAGAKKVRGYHVALREGRALSNLSGEKNEVADVVAAFVRGEATPGGPEGTWALADTWGPKAPLSTEPFWADERLVVRRPTDAAFRAVVRNVFGEMIRDLEPWPALTYDAIDLAEYLRAHPELGSGEWVEMTNARGEKVALSRAEIAKKKPVIVIGIDDERNLFRMFVTYNVHRTYSWKPETAPRALLVRHVGGFLFEPGEAAGAGEAGAGAPGGALHVVTLANFALTTTSFHVVTMDPLAHARTLPKALAAALTNEQGCLQCHTLRGEGARAHHLRASDGTLSEGFGLALEEYPRDVMQRFLFEQEAVSKSFGVNPLHVSDAAAKELVVELAR